MSLPPLRAAPSSPTKSHDDNSPPKHSPDDNDTTRYHTKDDDTPTDLPNDNDTPRQHADGSKIHRSPPRRLSVQRHPFDDDDPFDERPRRAPVDLSKGLHDIVAREMGYTVFAPTGRTPVDTTPIQGVQASSNTEQDQGGQAPTEGAGQVRRRRPGILRAGSQPSPRSNIVGRRSNSLTTADRRSSSITSGASRGTKAVVDRRSSFSTFGGASKDSSAINKSRMRSSSFSVTSGTTARSSSPSRRRSSTEENRFVLSPQELSRLSRELREKVLKNRKAAEETERTLDEYYEELDEMFERHGFKHVPGLPDDRGAAKDHSPKQAYFLPKPPPEKAEKHQGGQARKVRAPRLGSPSRADAAQYKGGQSPTGAAQHKGGQSPTGAAQHKGSQSSTGAGNYMGVARDQDRLYRLPPKSPPKKDKNVYFRLP